ncbi:MAG TPA: hypothetical protein VEF76_07945, partial [Patescibacteria group bacterium]|nr:hypothetical protein [Patescibacteria group bacterium]
MDHTQTTPQPEKTATAPKKKTRIAQMMLPQLDPNSALLPPDKWIIDTSWSFIRDNRSFRRRVGGVLGFGLGAFATVIGGAVAAFAMSGSAPVLGVAALTLGVAGFLAKKTADNVAKFKS